MPHDWSHSNRLFHVLLTRLSRQEWDDMDIDGDWTHGFDRSPGYLYVRILGTELSVTWRTR